MEMMKIEIIFNSRPDLAIWIILIRLLEKTIALGGVEIGIIKAQLDASVTGIARYNGSISIPLASFKSVCDSPKFNFI